VSNFDAFMLGMVVAFIIVALGRKRR